MANISLDSQIFSRLPSAADGKPTSRSCSLRNGDPSVVSLGGKEKLQRDVHDNGSSLADAILIPSDSESDDGDFDDSQSNTSFPPIDELVPSIRHIVESGSVAGISKSFNTISGGDADAKKPSVTDAANSDGRRSQPLTLAVESLSPPFEGVQDRSEEPSLAGMVEPSRAAASRRLQKPGAECATAPPSSSSPRPPSSPTPQQADPSPTNDAENPLPEASLALRNGDIAGNIRVPDTPGPSPDEDMVDMHWSESQRDPRFGQQRTRDPEPSPGPPTTTAPRRLSRPPRAVQQHEPVPQGSPSCEARQTSPSADTCSKTTTEISRVLPLGVDASHLVSSNHPTVPSSSENGTFRESTPHPVSAGRGDHDDEAIPPRVKPKAGRRRAVVRYGNRHSVDALGINDRNGRAEGVQQSDKDDDISPPLRKRRRVSSRRNTGLYRQDADDEVYIPSQDSDNEREARPRHKRRRLGPRKPAPITATGRQTSANYAGTGSRRVQIPGPPSSQGSSEHQESVKALSAKFTEWLLETAVVRSAIVDGVTTFQLQFKADLYCSKHSRRVLGAQQSDCRSNSPAKWHNSKPGPIAGALTSGKTPPVPQSDDDVQSLLLTKEAEWEVDKILETRKRGRGSQVLVKWVGFEKPTWEPLRNFLGAEALRAYMAEHEDIPPLSASGGPDEGHVVR
ncbi:hypothetical protein GQ53DRAFT_46862 [Thozetella sp. PMI_491]|nr:hypothetical protein GQ53DRAFT_46862 [Thozetella sp. PMI_491]